MNTRITLITILAITLTSCLTNVKGQTPQAVKNTFAKMYPDEHDPDWHVDKNGNYESNFKIKGVKYRADFKPNGTWIETETSISKKDLPYAIRKQLKEKYDDCKIVEIERVEHFQKGNFYDVELKKDGKKFDVEFQMNVTELNDH